VDIVPTDWEPGDQHLTPEQARAMLMGLRARMLDAAVSCEAMAEGSTFHRGGRRLSKAQADKVRARCLSDAGKFRRQAQRLTKRYGLPPAEG